MRVFVALLMLTTAAFAQDSPWEMRVLPAEESWLLADAYDVNSAGDVVGQYAQSDYNESRPVLWRDGAWIDMGLAYGQPDGWLWGWSSCINEAGLAAGAMVSSRTGTPKAHAVVWDTIAGTWTDLNPTELGNVESAIDGMNEVGDYHGRVWLEDGSFASYFWDRDGIGSRLFEVPEDYDYAQVADLNDSGWASGAAATFFENGYGYIAMIWRRDGSRINLHEQVVAVFPDVVASFAGTITEEGVVFGSAGDAAQSADRTVSYLWTWSEADGIQPFDMGGDPFAGFGGGNGRLMVGSFGQAGPDSMTAAVWVDGIPHRLPTIPGFGNHLAQSVNKKGVIIGNLVNPGVWWWWQGSRAFIAEPREEGDYDGDALKDAWELQGYTHDNGTHVDLFGMGANPLRRDLFVEIDAMTGHRPEPETLQPVIDAFKAHDIALHLSIDNDLPFDAELGTLDGLGRYQWDEFDALKAAHFDEELESAVRYCVFAHRLATLTDSGLARGEPSSDFIVSLGAFVEESGSTDPWMQAGTFMHELGHTLGLRHGGADVTNRKPNYLSVMNYDFQKQGLRIAGQDGNFDYSVVQLAELNENALVESAGLGVEPLVAGHQTLYRVVTLDPITFETVVETVWSGEVQGAIDWDGSGAIDGGTVSADINADGAKGALTSHHDWANLDFKGGTVGFGVGLPPPPPPPETEVVQELTVEEAKLIPPPPVEGLAGRAGRRSVRISWTPVGPYGQGTYKVYRWSDTTERVLVAETQASLISDRPGRGTWSYVVTVTDAVGAESLDSEELRLRVR